MVFAARRRDRPSESQVSPRAEWYDRNPITRTLIYYEFSIPPHTITVRASYTVPTGKKAFIESMNIYIRRATAATTSGRLYGQVRHTPSGGSIGILLTVYFNNNTVDFIAYTSQGESGVLRAGDLVELVTMDLSIGGSLDYSLTTKITEFDA